MKLLPSLILKAKQNNINKATMSTDHNPIDNIKQLIAEVKEYIILQKDYAKVEFVEKLSILLSTLIMIFVLLILGMVALFYLLFSLAYAIEPLVGGLAISFSIITVITILLMVCFFRMRKKLITNPLVRLLANLFLNS